MKERPILFSAPMVLALLAGTKTQTRRSVKSQPTAEPGRDGSWMWGHKDLGGLFAEHVFGDCMAKLAPCPYGTPGDRLWVRETFAPADSDDARAGRWEYRADNPDPLCMKWKPSIFMPRSASRLTLEVTGVCVERLQQISEADAKAEGVGYHVGGPVLAYRTLWKSINGAGSWKANPWVWVVTFKRIEAGNG